MGFSVMLCCGGGVDWWRVEDFKRMWAEIVLVNVCVIARLSGRRLGRI